MLTKEKIGRKKAESAIKEMDIPKEKNKNEDVQSPPQDSQ
jgi:hypothetical protein